MYRTIFLSFRIIVVQIGRALHPTYPSSKVEFKVISEFFEPLPEEMLAASEIPAKIYSF